MRGPGASQTVNTYAGVFLDTVSPPVSAGWWVWGAPLGAARLAACAAVVAAYVVCAAVTARLGVKLSLSRARPWTRRAAQVALASIGVEVRVVGAEHRAAAEASGRPFVHVANHISYLDALVLAAVHGPFGAVVGVDLPPVARQAADAWGCVRVRRAAPGGRAAALAARATQAGVNVTVPPLLCFPEGTVTTGYVMLHFRSGCFTSGAPVLPTTLRYDLGDLCAGTVAPHSPAIHLLRVASQPGRKIVTAEVLPMHLPTAAEVSEPADFARAVEKAMAASLGVSVSSLTSADALSLYRALGYGPSDGECA